MRGLKTEMNPVAVRRWGEKAGARERRQAARDPYDDEAPRCGKHERVYERVRMRRSGKAVCWVAARNGGLLNPQLLGPEELFQGRGYVDPRVFEEHELDVDESHNDWLEYQAECRLAEYREKDQPPLEVADEPAEPWECGHRVEPAFPDEEWDDVVADGYDPEGRETRYSTMGTCPSDWQRTMTVGGERMMAMPIVPHLRNWGRH